MYINAGYLHNSLLDFKDKSRPLIVGSCGTYRLQTQAKLPTHRPKGRLDYQLIYVAAGKAHFCLGGKDVAVSAGHMVLYRPKEVQKYVYYSVDHTEVFWVHFTGSDVKNILRSCGFEDDRKVFRTGTLNEYRRYFQEMIQELQTCKPQYEEMLSMLLHQLLILAGRQFAEKVKGNRPAGQEILAAAKYFSEHYNTDICIEDYAASQNMSTCWFIRAFKQYNHMTPLQYILSIRMANAQSLLETTAYNITEIAMIVGYDNPLYFSRLFKKHTGLSPSEYRQQLKGAETKEDTPLPGLESSETKEKRPESAGS